MPGGGFDSRASMYVCIRVYLARLGSSNARVCLEAAGWPELIFNHVHSEPHRDSFRTYCSLWMWNCTGPPPFKFFAVEPLVYTRIYIHIAPHYLSYTPVYMDSAALYYGYIYLTGANPVCPIIYYRRKMDLRFNHACLIPSVHTMGLALYSTLSIYPRAATLRRDHTLTLRQDSLYPPVCVRIYIYILGTTGGISGCRLFWDY